MMAEVENREGGAAAVEAAGDDDEKRLLMDDVTMLDFDMLCSTVVMQAQKGKWSKLNDEEENLVSENHQLGGGVSRMWEGELVYDCIEDRKIAIQSTCCPCYRFGKNMKRSGFGSCFIQGSMHSILVIIGLCNFLAFIIDRRRCFLYLAIAFILSVGTYAGYYRSKIRNKFKIRGSDSSFDDCVYHLICPCCALSQESRTLELNNVQDGIWHGRGDTICIGATFSEESKSFSNLGPCLDVSTKSPGFITMQKPSNENTHLPPSSLVGHSSPLVPPPE